MFRIFDDDSDGCIQAVDLVEVLTSLGERLTKSEARRLVQRAEKSDQGLIDYQGKKGIEIFLYFTFMTVEMSKISAGPNVTVSWNFVFGNNIIVLIQNLSIILHE